MGRLKSANDTTVQIDEIHDNTSTELIKITRDKLKIILMENIEKTESSKEWRTPAGLLISIVLTFSTTTEFKDTIGINGNVWEAIFILIGIISIAWLVIALIRKTQQTTIDELIGIIINKATNKAEILSYYLKISDDMKSLEKSKY